MDDEDVQNPVKHAEEQAAQIEAKNIAQAETQKEVLIDAAEVMRTDPATSTMLDIVRRTPDIFAEIQPILGRRDEFAEAALPHELHRTFTPLFTGIALSRRGRDLLEIAIDHHTDEESEALWNFVQAGHTYVPELMIGSGVHSLIYNAERMLHEPEQQALTVDINRRTGGQFAQPETAVWFLNTRTRPEDPRQHNVPGSAGSLNTLGRGVLQQADLSGAAFASQDTISLATRVDHLLSSRVLNETEVVSVRPNTEQIKPGAYIVELRRKDGTICSIQTDRIIIASGLGEPITGFEKSDEVTKRIIAEETAKLVTGADAQVMTFEEYAARVGDAGNPFPLQGFSEVAVLGAGDGGAVAAEFLLGFGPALRKSVAQLDRVERLHWVGQKSKTRDEFLMQSRQRYRDLALEFPVDDAYNHRINPLEGRAYKLERTEDGKIRVFFGVKGDDGEIKPSGEIEVDHIILATGFNDQTDDICEDVLSSISGDEKDELVFSDGQWAVGRRYKGTQIYKIGPAAHLPISEKAKSASPAMRRGKVIDSTPAVWASAPETAELARVLSGQPIGEGMENLATIPIVRETIILPAYEEGISTDPIRLEVMPTEVRGVLSADTISEDIVSFAVGEQLHHYHFPDDLKSITMQVIQKEAPDGNQKAYRFEVIVSPALTATPEYKKMLNELLSNSLLRSVFVRLTNKAIDSSQTLTVEIPINNKTIDASMIHLHVQGRS